MNPALPQRKCDLQDKRRLADSNRCFSSQRVERVNDPHCCGAESQATCLITDGAVIAPCALRSLQDPKVRAAQPEESQTPAGGPFGQREPGSDTGATRESRPITVYDVECPWCGVDAGKVCRAAPGDYPLDAPHVARRRAFRSAT